MRKDITTYIIDIARDNAQFIVEGGYESIADYIINELIGNDNVIEFFDYNEIKDNEGCEPTSDQVAELEFYLHDDFNYLPDNE